MTAPLRCNVPRRTEPDENNRPMSGLALLPACPETQTHCCTTNDRSGFFSSFERNPYMPFFRHVPRRHPVG
ncbi:hypothetical protein, partial [Streptomyces collinus]